MRDLINILDLSTEEIDSLIERAKDIKKDRSKYSEAVSYTHLTLPTIA